MNERIRHWIEDTDWDERIIESDRWLEIATLIACGFAVVYFFVIPAFNWLRCGYYGY